MAPTVIVLLQHMLTTDQRAAIDALLHTLARDVQSSERGYGGNDLGSWEVADFVGPVTGVTLEDLKRYPVYLAVSDMSEHDPIEEGPQLIETIGYYPQQRIVCDAASKEEANHRLLGHVVLQLTELLDGFIDLNYASFPTMHPEKYNQEHLRENLLFTNDLTEMGEIIPWVYDGPGRIYEIAYNHATWYYNIVDCAYFRVYLQSAEVYLGS